VGRWDSGECTNLDAADRDDAHGSRSGLRRSVARISAAHSEKCRDISFPMYDADDLDRALYSAIDYEVVHARRRFGC
jgi:hypothetical protein